MPEPKATRTLFKEAQLMRKPRSSTLTGFSAVAALLLGVACGSPANNGALFSTNNSPLGGGSGGSMVESGNGGSAGTSPTAGSGPQPVGGSAGALSTSGAGASTAGSGGDSAQGGLQNGGSAGSSGGQPNGGSAGGGTLSDCSTFGNGATYYSGTQHCYLVVHDMATFSDAETHCMGLGAHLATLSDQQENDFVWGLDSNDHWIGATDGKDPKVAGVGTYAWVDGEPFDYTDWSTGEPNGLASACIGMNGGGTCYEHCAFQWAGGANPGEWNDQQCAHTSEAVCEWDH